MTDMSFVPVGRVVKTHGLKGEVSMAMAVEPPFAYLEGVTVWIVPPAPGVPRQSVIRSVRPGPKGTLVSLEGITTIDAASALATRELLARTDDLPAAALAADEEPDVTGYSMSDPRYGLLGEVTETLITGANDVWVVEGPFGEVLVPVIDDVVAEIDDEARTIVVKLLDGLLPEEGELT